MSEDQGPTKVAIACQGGGSHTAFTAGVLKGVLREWDHEKYRLCGISGTSGGAFNAVAVWYGLLTGDEQTAIELLDALWADLTAKQPADRLSNAWLVGTMTTESTGLRGNDPECTAWRGAVQSLHQPPDRPGHRRPPRGPQR